MSVHTGSAIWCMSMANGKQCKDDVHHGGASSLDKVVCQMFKKTDSAIIFLPSN